MMINQVEYRLFDETNGLEVYENDKGEKYYLSGNIVSKDMNKLLSLKRMGMAAPIFDMMKSGQLIDCKEFKIKELI